MIVRPPPPEGGRRKRISPHLVRAPWEPVGEGLQKFYDGLMRVLQQPAVREGQWRLFDCAPAWDGNWTFDCFIAWSWGRGDGFERLIAVNYAGNQSQCYVHLPLPGLSGRLVRLTDMTGNVSYDRDGTELV